MGLLQQEALRHRHVMRPAHNVMPNQVAASGQLVAFSGQLVATNGQLLMSLQQNHDDIDEITDLDLGGYQYLQDYVQQVQTQLTTNAYPVTRK